MNNDKLKKDFPNAIELIKQDLSSPEEQKEFLNACLQEYVEDGNFENFYSALKFIIETRGSISSFAKDTDISRRALYTMFNGEAVPRLDNIIKVLTQLGFSLKVA
ncbi:MAG: hypothetical protein LBJ74_04345 [Heliobacteriaceae bacterium]|jgi:probable addiction module antidote protein|nr:hypothetical protein [Heliobacteriaceae bacterium]